MSINVLIVDDSSTMRKIVQRNLKQTGLDIAEVFQAGDGQEGLAVLNEQTVNLVLSDWNMPNMDGLGMVQAIRANEAWNHIQIIMIKPFTADDLEAEMTASRAA